jgi:signal peptidase
LFVVAAIVSLALVAPAVSRVFGYRTLVVTGGSMMPLARPGDVFILKPTPSEHIEPGQLITFHPLTVARLETHRVVRIVFIEGLRHFQTKGDANDVPDPNLVPAANVIGRAVLHVPYLGRLYVFAAGSLTRVVLVVVPALVLIAGEVRWLLRSRRRARRRRTPLVTRTAAVVVGVIAALAIAGPSAALYSKTAHVTSNTFSAGAVSAPTLTGATAGLLPCRVDLTWTAPSSGLAPDGYDVLRSTTSGGPYALIKHVGTVTSTSDGTVGSNTTYFYVLQSTRNSWKSSTSNQRSATTALVCV